MAKGRLGRIVPQRVTILRQMGPGLAPVESFGFVEHGARLDIAKALVVGNRNGDPGERGRTQSRRRPHPAIRNFEKLSAHSFALGEGRGGFEQ